MEFRVKPFVKWAGGKSKLLPQMVPFFPANFNNYFEPFLGSGAVYFKMQAELASKGARAYITDLNEELINLYKVVRDNVAGLIEASKTHIYDKDYYYSVRSQNPAELNEVKRASRMLFLNRTCFNGLWRVNSNGEFNVSFGKYENPTIVDEPLLLSANAVLNNVELRCCDFEKALSGAREGDFIYLDPPYYPVSSTANFTGYNSSCFYHEDHVRLRDTFQMLTQKGCFVALSNSNTQVVRELFNGCNIKTLTASRAINSDIRKRGAIQELLILSYPDAICRYNSGDKEETTILMKR